MPTDMERTIRLCDDCCDDSDAAWGAVTVPGGVACVRCGQVPEFIILVDERANEPRLASFFYGDPNNVEFTTCVAVESWPTVVWDVNRYYAELGVAPDATRAEIRERYQQIEGWRSERLTFIAKQLLDSRVRALYDATPVGSLFFDAYVEAYVRRKIADNIRDEIMQMGIHDDLIEVEPPDLSHLINQPFQVVDTPDARVDHVRHTGPRESWAWGFYVWQSRCHRWDVLARWRAMLIEALAEQREVIRLAVGFLGSMAQSWEVRGVGYRQVVFFNDQQQPDAEVARAAAARVVENRHQSTGHEVVLSA